MFVLTHVSLSLFRTRSSLLLLRFLVMHTRSVSRFFFVDRATSLLLLCYRSCALLPSLLLFRFLCSCSLLSRSRVLAFVISFALTTVYKSKQTHDKHSH